MRTLSASMALQILEAMAKAEAALTVAIAAVPNSALGTPGWNSVYDARFEIRLARREFTKLTVAAVEVECV